MIARSDDYNGAIRDLLVEAADALEGYNYADDTALKIRAVLGLREADPRQISLPIQGAPHREGRDESPAQSARLWEPPNHPED